MVLEQIQALLAQGKTAKDLIHQGFAKSSVYRARKSLANKEDPIKSLLGWAQRWGQYKTEWCSASDGKECTYFAAALDPLGCVFCPAYSEKEE